MATLVILSGGLIIGVVKLWASELDEGQQEATCRFFNEMRFAAKEKNPLNFPVGPNMCKSIHKEVPSEDYEQSTEGAKKEIRDLMVRCWYMWLEGEYIDMLNKKTVRTQPCFSCYTFSIKKDIEPFTIKDMERYLIGAYDTEDRSNKCARNGGGYCYNKKCTNPLYPKDVSSTKCGEEELCCVAKETKDECINKGGNCLPSCAEDNTYTVPFSKWNCARHKMECCIKPDNYMTYLDYFQADANGKVVFIEDLEFKPQENDIYSITFLSPGRECKGACWSGIIGSLGGGIPISLFLTPYVGLPAIGAGITLSLVKLGEVTDINYLLVSEYEILKNKCAVQLGEEK
ncbi:hypothetical protein GOV14_04710 [Candidatus Pacearchaeota archaeon]|nr:hypothetical protein [Candidatus Pacearchaeota archaeon]